MPKSLGSIGWQFPSGTTGISGMMTDRYRRLMSGQMRPWEMPEFRGMEYTLRRKGKLAREGVGRQMRVQGLRGPVVGQTLGRMEEQELAPMGMAMAQTYGRLPGQAMEWGKHIGALQEAAKGRMMMGRGQDIARKGQEEQRWLQLLGMLL